MPPRATQTSIPGWVWGGLAGLGIAGILVPRLRGGLPSPQRPERPAGDLQQKIEELRAVKANLTRLVQLASSRQLTDTEREEAKAVINTALQLIQWFDQWIASGSEELPADVKDDLAEVKRLAPQLRQLLTQQAPEEEQPPPGQQPNLEIIGTPQVRFSGGAVTVSITCRNTGPVHGQWEIRGAMVADVEQIAPDVEVEETKPSDGTWWQKLWRTITSWWERFLDFVRSIDLFPATSWLGSQTVSLDPGQQTTVTLSGSLPNVERKPIGCIIKAGRIEQRIDRPSGVQYGPVTEGCRIRAGQQEEVTAWESTQEFVSSTTWITGRRWLTIFRWSDQSVNCYEPSVTAEYERYRETRFYDAGTNETWTERTLEERGTFQYLPPSDYIVREQISITDAYDLEVITWDDTPVQCDKATQVVGTRSGIRVVVLTNTVTGETREERFPLREEQTTVTVPADSVVKLYPRIKWNFWLTVQESRQETSDTMMWFDMMPSGAFTGYV